jgi:AcrR family transcriptional regulator
MKTKDRILDIALRLFNEQGTGAVSTNHIAQAAGISPGNLYYYFRNKEEIIRGIFGRLFAEWDTKLVLTTDCPPTLNDVGGLIRANFVIMREYRFVYREIISLLAGNSDLRQTYAAVRERGYRGFHEIVTALSTSGVLTGELDPATVTRLADLCWLISEFWLSEVEVSGLNLDDTQMQRGIDLMMQVFRPYISG